MMQLYRVQGDAAICIKETFHQTLLGGDQFAQIVIQECEDFFQCLNTGVQNYAFQSENIFICL